MIFTQVYYIIIIIINNHIVSIVSKHKSTKICDLFT